MPAGGRSLPRSAAVRAGRGPGAAATLAERAALVVLLGVPAAVTVAGLRYYSLDRAARLRHPLHPALEPSGPVGLAFGIAGLALFLFMWLYPMRKRVRALRWAGNVGAWLRVHVVAGLSLPLLLAVHAGWRFDGLIGLGYLAMFIVCVSGIIGRYLYTRIPRTRQGVELSIDDVTRERRSLITRIAVATGLDPQTIERSLAVDSSSYAGLGPLPTVVRLVRDDLARWRTLRTLRRGWQRPRPGAEPLDPRTLDETLRLARRELTLSQQSRMLEATRRVFAYWHVAHLPFAITALLAVMVHVAVAVVVGGVGLR